MLVMWMAYATLLTAFLAAGAIAAEACARIWSAPRRVAWLIVLVASVVAPPILAFRSTTRPSTVIQTPRPNLSPRALDPAVAQVQWPTSPLLAQRSRTADVLKLAPYAAISWFIASSALLGLFALAVIRLRIHARSWRDTTVDGVPVFVSPNIGPAVIGTFRPRIVVAEWTLALDDTKRALMLCHELEHIRARDPLLLRLATLSLVAFPWNAPLWFVVRRFRESIEIDCDARVLTAVAAASDSPRDYGMLLLLVGARRAASLPTAAGFTGYPPFLERRIKAMTSQPPRRPTLASLGLLSLIVASTIAATRAPVPPSFRSMLQTATRLSHRPESALPSIASTSSLSRATVVATSAPHSTPAVAPSMPVDTLPPLASVDTNPPAQRDEWTPNAFSFQLAPPQGHATSREATGRVLDSATNSPLANVFVNVIGIQALNEPNWTCSDANGVFRLRVPVGEAWLSAQSADHDFARVTLAPTDSVAVLRGVLVAPRPAQSGRLGYRIAGIGVTPISSPSSPLIIVDGVVQPHDSVRFTPAPKIYIDGVEVTANAVPAPFANPCAK